MEERSQSTSSVWCEIPIEQATEQNVKFCVNCAHCQSGHVFNRVSNYSISDFTCHNPKMSTINLVTGAKTVQCLASAAVTRQTRCLGNWFEQVPEGQKTAMDDYKEKYARWEVEREAYLKEREEPKRDKPASSQSDPWSKRFSWRGK